MEVTDAKGQRRRLVLMTLASEYTFQEGGIWDLFLRNLRNITFTRSDGTQGHLAAHLVAGVMTKLQGATDECNELSAPFGVTCITIKADVFGRDNYGFMSPAFYGLAFAKVLSIVNTLSLGVDVLFLDCDQVSSDCYNLGNDTVPEAHAQMWAGNIGFLYMRSRPVVLSFALGWLHTMVTSAISGNPKLDQAAFPEAWTTAIANRTSKGDCGCSLKRVGRGAEGKRLPFGPDGLCKPWTMRQWYGFHVPCVPGDMNAKAQLMRRMLDMYEQGVGPVNSRSEPMAVV
ncbi:hypothetical protein HYH03_001873 [Edaphochlamys debaryana]|uniref:Nucleotide-diphospho-sugar transferase domain-containing protein n=1 Tax=Edaphochlamys debaryana TaxID=47281 RepID=A0A835YCA8_9CHLO|nr:hypothetical protein HYH03_001873 [Edaphochlamys debaryana]|eukprot:KAG2500295.1 hypothetical protein HYH03_001873 [Edaphochlamys debaryana]